MAHNHDVFMLVTVKLELVLARKKAVRITTIEEGTLARPGGCRWITMELLLDMVVYT